MRIWNSSSFHLCLRCLRSLSMASSTSRLHPSSLSPSLSHASASSIASFRSSRVLLWYFVVVCMLMMLSLLKTTSAFVLHRPVPASMSMAVMRTYATTSSDHTPHVDQTTAEMGSEQIINNDFSKLGLTNDLVQALVQQSKSHF